MTSDQTKNTLRLDKWLWVARFYKTRTLATKAIQQGKVRIDQQKANPARQAVIGMTLSIETDLYVKTITITGLMAQRQSAQIAQTLYTETQESTARREQALEARKQQKWMAVSAPIPQARPPKHQRRRMRAIKRTPEA